MSDLIIKGMKMPKRCQACEFYYIDFSDGETSCLATGCEVSIGDHCNKGCPLVEIPTPHGRLIDAGDLLDSFMLAYPVGSAELDIAFEIIENTDAIIEAEE